MAAQNDNLRLVLWLIDQGADVNAKNTLEPVREF